MKNFEMISRFICTKEFARLCVILKEGKRLVLSFKDRNQCDPMTLEKLHRNPRTPQFQQPITIERQRRRRHIIIPGQFIPGSFAGFTVHPHLD